MRAISRSHLGAGVFCASLGLLALAACADALHLDPPGAGSTGHADGGTSCYSNPDCAYPKPVCDTETSTCVECLAVSDCADKPGTVCSLGKCSCPDPSDTPCGTGATAACVDTKTSPDNCGSCGHACFGNCVGGKCADAWEPLPTEGAPAARSHHVAVWTGSQMFVWGGTLAGGTRTNTGGLYDPATSTWSPVSLVNVPAARADATAVWDDAAKVVVVWGGVGAGGKLGSGGRYDPAKNVWQTMTTNGAPSGRSGHTAVYASPLNDIPGTTAGTIIWGGADNTGHVADGAIYDAQLDKWIGIDGTGAPSAREGHTAVWDGSHMVVFGGFGFSAPTVDNTPLGDLFYYTPSTTPGTWGPPSSPGSPPGARYAHTATLDPTSKAMVVWGGYSGTTYLNDGASLGATMMWTLTGNPAPEPRVGHTSVMITGGTSSKMIVFGGDQGSAPLGTAWSLDLTTLQWTALPSLPTPRTHHTAVLNGATMLVWGGDTADGPTNTGAVLDTLK